jgi:ABC-type transport system substrate-binding protein
MGCVTRSIREHAQPSMFQSYQLNRQATLVPNPNWTPNEDPQAKQLDSKIVIELNINSDDLDNRLMAGDIDIDAGGTGVQAEAQAKILSDPSLMKFLSYKKTGPRESRRSRQDRELPQQGRAGRLTALTHAQARA